MGDERTVTGQIGDLLRDSIWGNPWHRLEEGAEGLTDEDLEFQPVPGMIGAWGDPRGEPQILKPLNMLQHVISVAVDDGAGRLADRTEDPVEEEWDGLKDGGMPTAETLVRGVDVAHRLGLARLATLTDDDLTRPDTAEPQLWEGADLGSMAVQMLVLHASWHFGQLAKLITWRKELAEREAVLPKATITSVVPAMDRVPWSFPTVRTRQELLVEVIRTAHSECPWHSLTRVLRDITEDELTWKPFQPHAEMSGLPIWHLAFHVAACDVIYADQAFGRRRDDWEWAHGIVGFRGHPWSPEECLKGIALGAEFLMERVASATDEQLDATYPMHHGTPLTGWQVAATMVQHRLWHGAQICMIREAKAALE
ncbi:MAG: hypothetical protein GF320_16655 [Armatimonadia bacterium]|nr:hypothetical protein [Armatimonadia bacterium]